MARFLLDNYRLNEIDDFGTRGVVSDQVAERMFHGRKQAGANLAVGSETNSRAGAAERFRYRRDNPDFTRSVVGKPETRGRLRAAREVNWNQRKPLLNSLSNLASGNYIFSRPFMARVKRHEFNEAHLNVIVARKGGKVCYFIFIVPAHDHGINLDRLKSCFFCSG